MNWKLVCTFFLVPLLLCSFAVKEKQKVNIVFIGDSITAGAGNPDGVSPPRFAGEYLRQQAVFAQVQVANKGVSGYTTVDFLPGHKTFTAVKAAAAPFYADKQAILVFSIMLGTNDSAVKGPNGAPVAPASYRANLKTIADSLFAAYPRCKVMINYPLWYSDNTHNTSTYMKEGQLRLIQYKKEINTLVNLYSHEKPRRLFIGDVKAYDYFKQHYQTDFNQEKGPYGIFFLHPNEKGDRALGAFWAKAVLRIVK